ncbi:hypothetical protein EJ08DRAFT_679918 [Tothia fuscella]|uniref:Uncharacterized protein n=1 Tax=Tothia fuscella TaxID=1048955 RepID=A0A9P4TWS2_9PEZI|nr:hypothetical protein EJ08DRAFT_679918 [Tothia fuscella]
MMNTSLADSWGLRANATARYYEDSLMDFTDPYYDWFTLGTGNFTQNYPQCKEYRSLAISETFLWLLMFFAVLAVLAVKRRFKSGLALLGLFTLLSMVKGAVDWHNWYILCTCTWRPRPIDNWAFGILLMAIACFIGSPQIIAAAVLVVLPFTGTILYLIVTFFRKTGPHFRFWQRVGSAQTTTTDIDVRVLLGLKTLSTYSWDVKWKGLAFAANIIYIVAIVSLLAYALHRANSNLRRQTTSTDRSIAPLAVLALVFCSFKLAYIFMRSAFAAQHHTWCDGKLGLRVLWAFVFPFLAACTLLFGALKSDSPTADQPRRKRGKSSSSSLSSSDKPEAIDDIEAPRSNHTVPPSRQPTANRAPPTRAPTTANGQPFTVEPTNTL